MAKGCVEINGIEVVRVSEGGGHPPFVKAVFQKPLVRVGWGRMGGIAVPKQ
jgi:hypothetical protein